MVEQDSVEIEEDVHREVAEPRVDLKRCGNGKSRNSVRPFPAAMHRTRPSTFSIVAFDPKTKDLGVAVESKFVAVGAVVPFAAARVGAVATQAYANTAYGRDALAMLKRGVAPKDVVVLKPDVVREIQANLSALGLYHGPTSGKFDPKTKAAFEAWAEMNNYENKLRKDGKVWGSLHRALKAQVAAASG